MKKHGLDVTSVKLIAYIIIMVGLCSRASIENRLLEEHMLCLENLFAFNLRGLFRAEHLAVDPELHKYHKLCGSQWDPSRSINITLRL